jgi:flagellar protein FliL
MAKSDPEPNEAGPAEAPGKPAKAPGAWGPVLAVLVAMPLISYAMTQFVLIPSLRSAVAEQQVQSATGGGDSKGGAHGAKDAAHGKNGEAGKATFSYDFDNIVVNLSGAMGTRYLKTSFTAFSSNAQIKTIITENKNQLLDVALSVLSAKSLADLEAPGSKNLVRNDLIENFNHALNSSVIEQIYFSEFVVQ